MNENEVTAVAEAAEVAVSAQRVIPWKGLTLGALGLGLGLFFVIKVVVPFGKKLRAKRHAAKAVSDVVEDEHSPE